MAKNTQTIRIDNVFGGETENFWFSRENQFQLSYNIDPGSPIYDTSTLGDDLPSGFLVPGKVRKCTGLDTITEAITWLVPHPKPTGGNGNLFAYNADGSVYTISNTGSDTAVVGLGDLNDGGTSNGDGCAYYDNYMYFSRSTTIARYGPLDGTPAFTDDYWSTTLGKTPLEDNTNKYLFSGPFGNYVGLLSQHHVLYAHQDNRLYIGDIVGNQGTIHYIKTKKTTVEGDTDDGSTYNALDLPYGWYPVSMTGYGDLIAIAINVRTLGETPSVPPKVLLWDGTSESPSVIIDKGFIDTYITAMVNISSQLYVFTCNYLDVSTRISRYIGGQYFEEVKEISGCVSPIQGGVSAWGKRILFAGTTNKITSFPSYARIPSILSMEVDNAGTFPVFNMAGTNNSTSTSLLFAISPQASQKARKPSLIYTSYGGSGSFLVEENRPTAVTQNTSADWTSGYFNINRRFSIKKITIPLPNGSTTGITPYIYTDHYSSEYTGSAYGLDLSRFSNKRIVELRPNGVEGFQGFCLRFSWAITSSIISIGLPIEIEIEIYDEV